MNIATNCDSEPFSLIQTKRQIFNSQHDLKMREYFQRENSKDDFEDQDDDNQENSKYIQGNKTDRRNDSHARPHTINIQHVEPSNRQTLIFENIASEPRAQGFHPVWKKGSLTIIKLVARFLYQLKTKAETLKFKLMNFHMFQYIDDKASDYVEFKMVEQTKNSSFQQKLFVKLKKMQGILDFIQYLIASILNKIAVMYPESKFKIIWDSIVVIFIIINIFFIPMELSFDLDKSTTLVWLFFETIPSYVFIVEILLNFNTAFYNQGIIHTKRSEIFNNYVKKNFWWDLVIAIPYFFSQLDIPYIEFVLLLRITRVKSLVQSVEDVLNLKESLQAVLELAKLIYFIIFVAHICSCAWHLLGKIEMDSYNDSRSWLVHYGYYDEPWHIRYIVSIYWSVITTLTVGYGDIVPQTSIEQLFVVIVAMIICGVFGYTISTIGEILRNLEEKKSEFKYLMKEVHAYIKEKQLSLQLSLKVRKYFEFYYQTQLFQKKSYQSVLKNLSEQLKQEIMIDLYKKILVSCKFINETLKDNLINELCQKVQQETFGPGDDIIDLKAQHEKKLIFIIDGEVESYFYSQGFSKVGVMSQNSGKFSRNYKKGDILGELEFITNSDYSVQYKAKVFTQVASITKHDLLQIIRKDKESAYKFQKFVDSLTFSKTLGRACEICKWTHLYYNCPFTFYQPNIWKVVRQAQGSIVPKRQSFERKPPAQKKFRSLQNSEITMATVIEYMLHKNFIQEEYLGSKLLNKFGFNYTNRLSQKEIQEVESSSSPLSSKQSSKSDNKMHNGSIYRKARNSQQSSIEKIERMKTIQTKENSHNNNNNNNNYLKPILTRLNSIGQSNLSHDDINLTPTPNQKKFPFFFAKKSSLSNIKGLSKVDLVNNNNQNEVDTMKETLKLQEIVIGPYNQDIDIMMIEENDFYPQYYVLTVIETYNKNRTRTISSIKKRKFHDKLKSIRLQKQFNIKLISPRLSQQVI